MGEETDIAEPLSSDDVKAAGGVTANEPSRKNQSRKRKNNLYKSIQALMEFYLGDANVSKNRFIFEKIQGQSFVYMDLSVFLTFNKMKSLTANIEDVAKAISKSEILQLSEDGTKVCRKTPIFKKENEDDCTIYVEQLGPDVDQEMLIKTFSQYGPVDYVSVPKFSHSNKNKGFAFVEFKDEESAKKALEVFNAKGCCLSPHMAPEDLMSIKNFEKKDNKKAEDASESEHGDNQGKNDGSEQVGKGKKHSLSESGSASKRKSDVTIDEEKSKKGKKAEKFKTNSKSGTGNKENKRKRSVSNELEDETEHPEKKIKSESEDVTESEVSHTEDDNVDMKTPKDAKKKRLRKKVKKDKSPAVSLGLKVLSKKEWKKLRNNYLNMQKNTMRSLKQQLSYSKRERNRIAPVEKKKGVKEEKLQSGTVIKVMLDEPVTNVSATKNDMRVHPDIKYVDVKEGNSCVYLRTSNPDLATSLTKKKQWPNMQVIEGDEEAVYWTKIKMDREELHKSKQKNNQRGRSKLLKRAERFQGKHITTIEAS